MQSTKPLKVTPNIVTHSKNLKEKSLKLIYKTILPQHQNRQGHVHKRKITISDFKKKKKNQQILIQTMTHDQDPASRRTQDGSQPGSQCVCVPHQQKEQQQTEKDRRLQRPIQHRGSPLQCQLSGGWCRTAVSFRPARLENETLKIQTNKGR